MANKKNTKNKTRKKNYNDKSIRSIDKNLDNSKVFDTKKLYDAKHVNDSSLEDTNVAEFHFDDKMLDDFDSLDTSFIDGKGNTKKKAKKELNKRVVTKKIKVKRTHTKGMNVVAFTIIVLLAIMLGGILTYVAFYDKFNRVKIVKNTEVKEEMVVDENIVFLGDSLFEGYDLEYYFPDKKMVNSGISGNTTTDLLDNMNFRVYRYNPSKVFILIGINDLYFGETDQDKIVNRVEKIINGIKKNRKLSDIYLLSIFPVNDTSEDEKITFSGDTVNNEIINEVNSKYKKLAKDKEITYINVHDSLMDDEGNLKVEYTKEGLHLIDAGYEVVTKCINKYLEK